MKALVGRLWRLPKSLKLCVRKIFQNVDFRRPLLLLGSSSCHKGGEICIEKADQGIVTRPNEQRMILTTLFMLTIAIQQISSLLFRLQGCFNRDFLRIHSLESSEDGWQLPLDIDLRENQIRSLPLPLNLFRSFFTIHV